jgi:hypothetical protein
MVESDIKPSTVLEFEHYTSDCGNWNFYHSIYGMSNSKELDKLQDLAECELPEVFYGKNMFLVTMPLKDLLIEVNPVESVSLSAFLKRDKYLRKSTDAAEKGRNDENLFVMN